MTIKEKLFTWYSAQFLAWRDVKSKLTIKWNALLISVGIAWNFLPPEAQTKIVESALAVMKVPTSWALVGVGIVGFFFRMKKQAPKDEPKAPVEPTVVTEPDSPDDIAADKRIEQLRAETGQS